MTSSFSRRSFLASALGFAVAATALPDLVGTRSAFAADAVANPQTGRIEYLPASRVVDSRTGLGVAARLTPGVDTPATISGLPAGTIAVWLNLTIVDPGSHGWAAVWSRTPWSGTSSINFPAHTNRAVLVLVKVDSVGRINLRSSTACDVLCDVVAAVVATTARERSGRMIPTEGVMRLVDTASGVGGGAFAAGEWRRFDTPPVAHTASGALLTISARGNGGYWTVATEPTDGPPSFSTLNPAYTGGTSTNQAVVGFDAAHGFWVYSSRGGHCTIDAAATITGAGSQPDTVGLVQPLTSPTRILDTRETARSLWSHVREIFAGQWATVQVLDRLPVGSSGVIGSVVAVRPVGTGSVFCGHPDRDTVATFAAGDTVAGHALIPVALGGEIKVGADGASTHLVVDAVATLVGRNWQSASKPQQAGLGVGMPTVDWSRARVDIPCIGVSLPVGDGVTGAVIDIGHVGVATGSGLGDTNRPSAIGAHRKTHGGVFRRIAEVVPGSEVRFSDGRRTVRWKAESSMLLPVDEFYEWLPGGAKLTDPDQMMLFACADANGNPGGQTHRWMVFCKLASVTR